MLPCVLLMLHCVLLMLHCVVLMLHCVLHCVLINLCCTELKAINIYTAGGEFAPHTDKEALSLLIPLSPHGQ
jgi:hypothetical protein